MSYVRCIDNSGYEVSLSMGKIYKTLPDNSDQVSLRVIDNEGEDYLYDARRFEPVELTDTMIEATIGMDLPESFYTEKPIQTEQILYTDFADKNGFYSDSIRFYLQNPCTKFLVGLRKHFVRYLHRYSTSVNSSAVGNLTEVYNCED